MERKHLEWRVGLFVLVGLTVLAMLLLQFSKGTSLFRPTYNLYLTAKNVGGLKTRASVLMAGVQVGSVSGIKLNPQGRDVTITLRIYKEFDIYKDARFVIEQSGFLGDQYVAIEPTNNEGPTFKSGDMASAQEPFNLQEVARSASGFIERIDETARKLNDAVTDVRRLVLNEQTLTNLAATVGNMRVASQHALATVDNLNSLVGSSSPLDCHGGQQHRLLLGSAQPLRQQPGRRPGHQRHGNHNGREEHRSLNCRAQVHAGGFAGGQGVGRKCPPQ